MPSCPTYLVDIGPNLLQVLINAVTLAGTFYGITRVLANGKAAQVSTAAIIANGHAPINAAPK
jgi:hypothetical protein